jgi:glycine/D-amino acid oxidase-like deaminating enzyme
MSNHPDVIVIGAGAAVPTAATALVRAGLACFFAGEATDFCGHSGTVHGAIASGQRAADEIIKGAARRTFAAGRAVRKTKLTASK